MSRKLDFVLIGALCTLGSIIRDTFGQCVPYAPPSACASATPIDCPADINGDFCNGEPWYLGPGGSLGVLSFGSQIQIDQNCDGDVNDAADAVYNLPSAIVQLMQSCSTCQFEYRLSPSQDTLYVRAFQNSSGVPGCSALQSRIYFYALGAAPNLIAFSGIHQGACMNSPAIPPVFHDQPGNPIRTAVVVGAEGPTSQPVYWADLVNHQVNLDAARYATGLQTPQFSQRGNAVFIRALFGGTATRYALADLCSSPVAAGSSVAFGPFPQGTTGVSASVTGFTGNRHAVISYNGGGSISVPLNHCLCGACCDDGCTNEAAANDCAGTFFAADTCSPNPCSGPGNEACCFVNGTCSDMPAGACSSSGGLSQGTGTSCLNTTCAAATEACCIIATGQCVDLSPSDCSANAGSPEGPGSNCTSPQCPPPPGTEACCLSTGGCLNLPPVGPFPSCTALSGTPQGTGTNCLNGMLTCPTTVLTISKSGPASAGRGELLTYTITYGNSGPSTAASVQVRETLPSGTTFIAASLAPGGIAPTVSGNQVTWSIGTLPAGTTGQQVTVTLLAPCTGSSVVNTSCTITGSPGGTVAAPAVTTALTAGSTAPVTMSLASVDLNGTPLKENDLIEHTITLTNTVAQVRTGLLITGAFSPHFTTGHTSTWDSVVNAGGGAFAVDSSPGTQARVTWRGSLPASGTVTLVFRTRLTSCADDAYTTEALNAGSPLVIQTPCGAQVGSTAPPVSFPIYRRIVGTIQASNLNPGHPGSNAVQVARAVAALDFEMTLANQENTAASGVSVGVSLPADLIVANPPFVGPQPATTTYDAANRRISFQGTVPASGQVTIRWAATLSPAAACSVALSMSGGTQECVEPLGNIGQSLRLLIVPEPPATGHVVGVDNFRGLSLLEPGVDSETRVLLCLGGEVYESLAQTTTGQLWMIGRPTVWFDPANLDVQVFADDFLNRLAVTSPTWPVGGAHDPFTDTLIITGFGASGGRVMRFDHMSDNVSLILETPSLAPALYSGRCVVDHEGFIAVLSAQSWLRIDPAHPAAFVAYPYANIAGPIPPGATATGNSMSDIALDVDGNYLAMIESRYLLGFPTSVNWIGKINRLSGAVSVVAANVRNLDPSITGSRPLALAAAPNGALYFSQDGAVDRLYETQRPCLQTDLLGTGGPAPPFGTMGLIDLAWSAPITGIGPSPDRRPSDFDLDCDVDLVDLDHFVDCNDGPNAAPVPTPPATPQQCLDAFDADGDGDVDLVDAAEFMRNYGP